MVAQNGWEIESWERRQWWRKLVTMIVFLVLCVGGLVGWSRSLSGTVFAVFCIVFAGLGLVMVWVARMTRFVAVTPDALVLAFRGSRVRVPWDDLADAFPVREQGLTPSGHTVQRKMTRSIALLPSPTAVAAPPALLRAVRWHLSRPHTLDALIEGHATGWHGDLTRTEGR